MRWRAVNAKDTPRFQRPRILILPSTWRGVDPLGDELEAHVLGLKAAVDDPLAGDHLAAVDAEVADPVAAHRE